MLERADPRLLRDALSSSFATEMYLEDEYKRISSAKKIEEELKGS
jgi:hypothetical protein